MLIESDMTVNSKGRPFNVEVRLAVHRGNGRLIVGLRNAGGRIISEKSVAFDPAYLGGDGEAGYQKITIPFEGLSEQTTIMLSVQPGKVSADSETVAFFIAAPRLVMGQAPGSDLTPHIVRLGEAEPTFWYKATLGEDDRDLGNGLSLTIGETGIELLPAGYETVQRTANWGHLLEFSASAPVRTMVYVDGECGFAFAFSKGHNALRIPPLYLTGEYRKIELRDEAGFRVLWRDWILAPRQLTSLDHLQREGCGPYPTELFPQSPDRFKALRAHLAAGADAVQLQQIAIALEALEAGYESLKLKPLHFPVVENPDVSIVIPAHNKVEVSYACMCALLLAYNKASFEVILVDDGSTDATAEFESIVAGIKVVRNVKALRFIGACNAGAAAAQGKYVVLLNNDTEPTIGWLDALIDAFERFDNVGLVGSKLLFPDGRLQEAGGIIWGTGDPWNYGRLQNPAEPRYSYARQADYLSGAAMMTTKEIWDDLGGLSAYLEPMYFEDTDFAFKVRKAGFTTWFVPASVVYHYEGATSGTDTSSGFKRFQEVNRPKFKRQWATSYANFSPVGHKPDLEKDRGIIGRVLFIDTTTPTPDRDAGSYAALQEIRLVQSLGYKVTFLPENLAYMGHYTTDLEKQGIETIVAPFYTSMRQFLEDRASEFDAFYITRYHVVNNAVRSIRELVPEAKVIMNGADLHYLRLLRRGMSQKSEEGIAEARRVRDEEFDAMRSVDVVLSYNDTERAIIEAASEGQINVQKCPWVLDMPSDSGFGRDERKGLSFLGSFQHHPNVEGLEWFAHSVMTELATARPDISLSVYGSRMSKRIKALASANIDTVGFIEDVNAAYNPHRIFVAPLLSGAGIKGKVLSALAHGIPCILSPVAAEGVGLRDGADCFVADKAAEWVEKIIRLYDNPSLWEKFRQNSLELARDRFSFEKGRDQMRVAFEAVDLFKSRP
jgi:GT2 family glycosyltransferase/glycosyltransferase involved in cell wall biosynthesis